MAVLISFSLKVSGVVGGMLMVLCSFFALKSLRIAK